MNIITETSDKLHLEESIALVLFDEEHHPDVAYDDVPFLPHNVKLINIFILIILVLLIASLTSYTRIFFPIFLIVLFILLIYLLKNLIHNPPFINFDIDKKNNTVTISHLLISMHIFTYVLINPFLSKKIKIPLLKIKKVEYHTWTPVHALDIPTFSDAIVTWGKMVFILHDDSKIELYSYGAAVAYELYKKLGKKIADYIHVPFEM